MQKPFLQHIAEHVHRHYKDKVERLCIVLPGKRGALFLKHHLGRAFNKTVWLPDIRTSEELIADFSGLTVLEDIDLLCHLYESYRICYGEKSEPFDSFARWGQLILQDFNEIDRYLADPSQLYENLKDIKVIEQWSLGEEELTDFQKDYLHFMSSLGAIYRHFNAFLLQNKWAYQGLAYREAVNNMEKADLSSRYHKVIFCGFNALNEAEIKIYRHLHKMGLAEMLWDGDPYYLNNPEHEAGHFLRKNLQLFPQKEELFIEDHFRSQKNIEIISVPKQIGQSQVVKQTLEKYIQRGITLDRVAVVLANEKLLWPVLKQLPAEVEHVNVTMEYPLKYTATYALMDAVLQIQLNYHKQNRKEKQLYYQDLLSLLDQPLLKEYLLTAGSFIDARKISAMIREKNLAFISSRKLDEIFDHDENILSLIKHGGDLGALTVQMERMLTLLQEAFRKRAASSSHTLEQEYLNVFLKNFNRMKSILKRYPHFSDIRSYRQLFVQIVGNTSAPFIGEPLKGLQVMGVLETRTLDFEHLILVNINESVLPAGKSMNSFIPNDLKRAFRLPLYTEKDAIFSYHFYRLLQRAEEVTITYDSETDTFGKGEKSRFITQLEIELSAYCDKIRVKELIATDIPSDVKTDHAIVIPKTTANLERIIKKAVTNDDFNTLSPSSLTLFLDCPLKFYFRYGAGLKEMKAVEESAESNTFGVILHESLETLYKPFIGKALTDKGLKEALQKTGDVVKTAFHKHFSSGELSGKMILQYEVIKHYTEKQLKNDLAFVNHPDNGKSPLVILALEERFVSSVDAELMGQKETIWISGKMDRIDRLGDQIRIIDYKNSVSTNDDFKFTSFDSTISGKKFHKQFQLFMYAWLLHKNNYCTPDQLQPGIIAFRSYEDHPHMILSGKNPLRFSRELLDEFETHLIRLIEELFGRQPFTQTDDAEICKYCDYKRICVR